VRAEELKRILDPACVLMNIRASTFDECLGAFTSIIDGHPAVSDPGLFMERVRAREAAVSTVTPDHIAFPHARTDAVSRLFLAVGRSDSGVSFRRDLPIVHLVPRRRTGECDRRLPRMRCMVGKTRACFGKSENSNARGEPRGISQDHCRGEFVKTPSDSGKASLLPSGRQRLRWWLGVVERFRPRELQITLVLAGLARFLGAIGSLAFRKASDAVHWVLTDNWEAGAQRELCAPSCVAANRRADRWWSCGGIGVDVFGAFSEAVAHDRLHGGRGHW
jgi:Phosphoenolpyruvate-dependent sugar phosphotransferase system, EIIA 2